MDRITLRPITSKIGVPRGGFIRMAARLRTLRRARSGNVAVMFALLTPVIVLFIGGVIDLSSMVDAKTHLQDATDAASLAVSAATAQNPSATETQLQTLAQSVLNSDFSGATLTDFHVCAPSQNDCTDNGSTMANDTVAMTTSTAAPCYLGRFLPGVCTGGGTSRPLYVNSTATIGLAKTLEFNFLLDTSGSMIVGADAPDVNKVITWNNVAANWATVRDPNQSTQSTPCAFACHDEGYARNGNGTHPTTLADMAKGLTNAHAAGAQTRFDVMQSAAGTVISQLQQQYNSQNGQNSRITYLFNILQFNDNLVNIDPANPATGQPKQDVSFADATTAVSSNLYVGLDTYLNEALASENTSLGSNGTGVSAASPLKFLIIVTDGLESDFQYDFTSCSSYNYDPNYPNADYSQGWLTAYGCFAKTLDTTKCTAIKNKGIVVAVLETPYVPLTGTNPKLPGEDPNDPYTGMGLYEGFVRHIIYPTSSSSSTVSAALSSCASPGYYLQASQSAQIATDFLALVQQFVASVNRVQH